MAASRAVVAISRQVDALRSEEASEGSWFALPEEGDDDVNWMNFQIEIVGPDSYTLNPTGSEGTRPSPYSGGLFRVSIKLNENYPTEAPEVLFKTRVWHPNVHPESGKPCIDLLREQWKPTHTLRDVLVFLRDLLAAPNASDSVNPEAAREIMDGYDVFDKHAADETARYAAE